MSSWQDQARLLRESEKLTLDQLVKRFGVPRTTLYKVIRDLPRPIKSDEPIRVRQRRYDQAYKDRIFAKYGMTRGKWLSMRSLAREEAARRSVPPEVVYERYGVL